MEVEDFVEFGFCGYYQVINGFVVFCNGLVGVFFYLNVVKFFEIKKKEIYYNQYDYILLSLLIRNNYNLRRV